MNIVSLPPDLEQFAQRAIDAGRYRDMTGVVSAAMGLLKQMEADREAMIVSLEEAQAERVRLGFTTIEDLSRDMDSVITLS